MNTIALMFNKDTEAAHRSRNQIPKSTVPESRSNRFIHSNPSSIKKIIMYFNQDVGCNVRANNMFIDRSHLV